MVVRLFIDDYGNGYIFVNLKEIIIFVIVDMC